MSDDIHIEVIKNTQKVLGKYIKKPPLTEKLLRKPPFRFLHDVIKAVIKETGFLKGLFSDNEMNSDNVKEKEAKINFLNKLIDAIKTLTNEDLNVRPGKIVAGLEPENTNLLLQSIGKAIDSKVESSEYVKKINQLQDTKTNQKKATTRKVPIVKKSNKTTTDKEIISKTPKAKPLSNETPKSKRSTPKVSPNGISKIKSDITINQKNNILQKNTENIIEEEKVEPKNIIKPLDIEKKIAVDYKEKERNKRETKENKDVDSEVQDTLQEAQELQTSNNESYQEIEPSIAPQQNELFSVENIVPKSATVRPKSARPKSGDKDSIQMNEIKPVEMTIAQSVQRPKSSLRPPSVRPSSARPGAPRLRPDSAFPTKEPVVMGNINVIIENVDTIDDEETVIIEKSSETIEDATTVDIPLKNKGHLVEQILEQFKGGENISQNVEVDWETNASQTKERTSKEIAHLRSILQNLTKAANPLGKLMNYLHEDLDGMYSELQMWTNTKKQLYEEIQKQKRLNIESKKPLLSRLDKLDQDIRKQQQEISDIQSNILRNDVRIKELIAK